MSKYLNMITTIIKMRLSESLTYRLESFINGIGELVNDLLGPLLAFFIYEATSGLPGWSFYEFVLFNATTIISGSIAISIFMPMVWSIGWKIDKGYFDEMLTKPLNIIAYMIIEPINLHGLTGTITGITIVIICIFNLGYSVTLAGVITYIYIILLSGIAVYGVVSLAIGLSFKLFKVHQFMQLFWDLQQLGEYPLNIYKTFIPFILTFIFPIAVANYYPASFLLDKITDFSIIIVLTIVSAVFAIIGTLSIKYGIKYYSSAGG